jgi:hypothetical protein
VRVLKTKRFARWARKERLGDLALLRAVDEIENGLVDANLGGGLLKKRVARSGAGRRGGYRTLLAADLRTRWVFLYGFAKNERDNVDEDELRELKRLAQVYLAMREDTVDKLLEAGELMEAKNGESQAA